MKCSIAASPFVERWFYPSSDCSSKFVRRHLLVGISRKVCRVYKRGAIVFPLYKKELGDKILKKLFNYQ